MPLFSRLLAYFTGHLTTFQGPWSLSLPVSLTVNAIGLLFLAFCSITFNFPYSSPVTKDSMNYTSAAIGVIALISVVTWLTTGRKQFTGPADVGTLMARTRSAAEKAERERLAEGKYGNGENGAGGEVRVKGG